MSLYRSVRSAIHHRVKGAEYSRIYDRYHEFTMVPRETFVDNLKLAAHVSHVDGCVVECGVWRGGMSAALVSVLGAQRKYILCDSFEGLPPAKAVDGEAAIQWQQDKQSPGYYDNCTASEDFAQKAMALAGASSVTLIKGWFDKTLPGYTPPEPIALLRLDGDWYESTMVCLEALFPHVTPGGMIILDDYYTWDGCSRALHDYLSRQAAVERIQNLGGVCYVMKAKTAKVTATAKE